MEEQITKEALEKLAGVEGESRGTSFKADGDFILKEKGEEGLLRLEERMAELGYPIKYKEMKATDFFPSGLRGVELLVIRELFNFTKEDFAQMGIFQTKISLILKLFMKFFVSLDVLSKKVPEMWRRYYTVGDLKVIEINTAEKYLILTLSNFALHPFHCQLLEGYFANTVKMVMGVPVTCEETKCIFKGDSYHEFVAKW